jgi:uncharacterized membrane protein
MNIMMRRLAGHFLRGLAFLAPIVITAYVCYVVFITVDGWLGIPIPGAGFVVTIALITLIGFLASNLLTRSFLAMVEEAVNRLPVVRLLYQSTKELLNAFVGEKRRFKTAVMVTLFQGGDVRALGFVTQESLAKLGLPGDVAVYFPFSYSLAGHVLICPAERVQTIDADSAEVMAFIVSGGVTALPARRTEASVSASDAKGSGS